MVKKKSKTSNKKKTTIIVDEKKNPVYLASDLQRDYEVCLPSPEKMLTLEEKEIESKNTLRELDTSINFLYQIPGISLHDIWYNLLKSYEVASEKDCKNTHQELLKKRNYHFQMAYDQALCLSFITGPFQLHLRENLNLSLFNLRIQEIKIVYFQLLVGSIRLVSNKDIIYITNTSLFQLMDFIYGAHQNNTKDVDNQLKKMESSSIHASGIFDKPKKPKKPSIIQTATEIEEMYHYFFNSVQSLIIYYQQLITDLFFCIPLELRSNFICIFIEKSRFVVKCLDKMIIV
jgi:hypothetical protein